jgi:hypothetical protein
MTDSDMPKRPCRIKCPMNLLSRKCPGPNIRKDTLFGLVGRADYSAHNAAILWFESVKVGWLESFMMWTKNLAFAEFVRFCSMAVSPDSNVLSDEAIYRLLKDNPTYSMQSSAITPAPEMPAASHIPPTMPTATKANDASTESHHHESKEKTTSVESRQRETKVIQYPSGDFSYCISISDDLGGISFDDARKVGWATTHAGTWTARNGARFHMKHCLGVFCCPEPGCMFAQRPPQAGGKPRIDVCNLHGEHPIPLELVPCDATIKFMELGKTTTVIHSGHHNHIAPLPIRASPSVAKKMTEFIQQHPDIGPRALQTGSRSRESVLAIDPIFTSHAKVKYARKKAFKNPIQPAMDRHRTDFTPSTDRHGTDLTPIPDFPKIPSTVPYAPRGASTFIDLSNFEESVGEHVLVSVSLELGKGHISYQSAFMRNLCLLRESTLETDSIEGFLKDDPNQQKINVCITSGFCALIKRNVILLATILMGKSSTHYAEHFKVLFKTMNMSTNFADWTDDDPLVGFPGNTSDFSEAERQGFQLALFEHCQLNDDMKVDLSQFYRCCSVHFKRNLEKVCRSQALLSGKNS